MEQNATVGKHISDTETKGYEVGAVMYESVKCSGEEMKEIKEEVK
jgi:hypothetical protein